MRWFLALLALTIISCSHHSDIELVKEFVQARKDKDSIRYMKMVSPGMRVWYEERKGEGTPWKPTGIWSGWDDYFHSQNVYGEYKQDSNAVTAIVGETNDFYKLIERPVSPVQYTWWISKNKKIEGFMVKSLANEKQQDKLQEFVAWAKNKDSVELNYIMPNGRINPAEDRPQRWKKMLVTWRKETGMPLDIPD